MTGQPFCERCNGDDAAGHTVDCDAPCLDVPFGEYRPGYFTNEHVKRSVLDAANQALAEAADTRFALVARAKAAEAARDEAIEWGAALLAEQQAVNEWLNKQAGQAFSDAVELSERAEKAEAALDEARALARRLYAGDDDPDGDREADETVARWDAEAKPAGASS